MRRAAVALAPCALALAVAAAAQKDDAPETGAGSLYDRYCLACHGERGDGQGPASPWLYPRPRDLTRARYKWRSTPSGKPPTAADLSRVIEEGAPGTSMPGFAGVLDAAQVAELVRVVQGFAPERFARPATAVAIPAPPADLASRVARGKELWATSCATCHGQAGRGDGSAAAGLKGDDGLPAPPFDLTAHALRGGGDPDDVYRTLVTGLDGTPMASFTLPEDDLWALVAFVRSIRATTPAPAQAGPLDPRAGPAPAPGLVIAAQGDPPAALPPAAASLSPAQCGRCHAKQLREWTGSLHGAASSPGLLAQLVKAKPSSIRSCQSCHAPLAEQLPGEKVYDAELRGEGITCAACHVRGHTRHGPPRRADSALLAIDSYPVVEDAVYERSDFCLPCHQLPLGDSPGDRPLLDTYREWLEGPYMKRGVQCQHCHMPDREHSWKGVHDQDTVAQGLDVTATARRDGGEVVVTVTVENVGAGHYLPTTPTPALFLSVEVGDARREKRIGRHIEWLGKQGWKQHEDTRIPPGDALTFTARFTKPNATTAGITLRVHPDDYYEGFYRRQLARKDLAAAARRLYEEAAARAGKSHFVVWERDLTLPK